MIHVRPSPNEAVDQGDLIDNLAVSGVRAATVAALEQADVEAYARRVVVLTQTCDFAQAKTTVVNVAEVFEAEALVQRGILKAADVRGPLRGARVWGFYFLPADAALGLPEMIVDLHRLHTVPLRL